MEAVVDAVPGISDAFWARNNYTGLPQCGAAKTSGTYSYSYLFYFFIASSLESTKSTQNNLHPISYTLQ